MSCNPAPKRPSGAGVGSIERQVRWAFPSLPDTLQP